jgi:aryl-alcohol dehydrogenase-like predicted oxidoreductase
METMNLSTWHGMRARDPRRLVLGAAQWGMPHGVANRHGEPSDEALRAMLERAGAAGVRTIETARGYGRSEARIGRALAGSAGGWRVLTKLAPEVHREGLGIAETLERVSASLEASRSALGLDALPVLMLHRFGHRHACGGRLWRTLLAERDAGRIGSLGAYAATPEEAWAALEDPDIEVLQVASSLLDLRLHRQGFFPRARELGRTIYVHGVFLYGVAHLDPRLLPPSLARLAEPMQTIAGCAARLGVPPRALHLAFARELPGIHPVVGCETEAQIADLLDDWTGDHIDAATVAQLVDALPTLEADVVDPARWPGERLERGAAANQTAFASVATIPG